MKKIILLFFVIIYTYSGYSQISKIFYTSYGMSLLSDFHISSSPLTTLVGGDDEVYYTSYQHMQFNFVSFQLAQRVNVLPLTEDMTVSIHLKPTIAYGVAYQVFDGGTWYNFECDVPVFLEYNYGLVSRYSSTKDFGIVVGVGVAYTMSPFFGYSVSSVDIPLEDYKNSWFSMVGEVGYRYLNDKNNIKEINFSFGIGQDAKEFITFEGDLEKEKRPVSYRLSFLRILNY